MMLNDGTVFRLCWLMNGMWSCYDGKEEGA
jgi:hypothetical protein